MFDTLSPEENQALWSKLISANRKFRHHAEYLISLAERYRNHGYNVEEVNDYLNCANEQHDSLDELTILIKVAI